MNSPTEETRVLFVTHTVAMQGANHSLLQLMLELKDRHRVVPIVLMPHIPTSYAQWNMLLACRQHHIECYSYRSHWFKNTLRLVSYLRCLGNVFSYPYIYHKLKSLHVSLIHSNGSVTSLGAYLSRRMKVPHVWHIREFGDLDFSLHSLWGSRYERWVYRHADVFIAISQAVKDHYQSVVPPAKTLLIYNGIVPPANPRLPAPRQAVPLQICLVGILSEWKNQIEALRAVDLLVNQWGVTDFHLSLIGYEEKVCTALLRSFVAEHQLGSYVSFLGERNDVMDLLAQMHVGLMLSKNEAFGRVTVEYMMQGLAVVASSSGANPEIVDHGATGLLYNLGNAEELAHALKLLINDDAMRCAIAGRGQQKALRTFTSEKNTAAVNDVYTRLIQPCP